MENQNKYLEYQLLAQQIQQVREHLEVLEEHIEGLKDLKVFVDNLSSVKEGEEILVPLGQGIFFNALVKKPGEFLMNVGAGVVVEKKSDSVLENVDGQLIDVDFTIQELSKQLETLHKHAEKIIQEEEK